MVALYDNKNVCLWTTMVTKIHLHLEKRLRLLFLECYVTKTVFHLLHDLTSTCHCRQHLTDDNSDDTSVAT